MQASAHSFDQVIRQICECVRMCEWVDKGEGGGGEEGLDCRKKTVLKAAFYAVVRRKVVQVHLTTRRKVVQVRLYVCALVQARLTTVCGPSV